MAAQSSQRPDWRLFATASAGLFGVQIVWGLQNISTSRIFQTLGADMADLPMLWIAGPVTGLLIQPLVGHFSDRSRSRFGRRRPFLLVGALLTAMAMLGLGHARSLTEAVIALWLLTAAVNIAMQPLRAHLADLTPPDQRGVGYTAQVIFIGSGAVLASALPWLLGNLFGVASQAPPGQLPATVGAAFTVGAVLLLASVAISVRTPDPPLPSLASTDERSGKIPLVSPVHVLAWVGGGLALAGLAMAIGLRREVYLLAAIAVGYGTALARLRALRGRGEMSARGLIEIVANIAAMPAIMKRLALVQFFTWFGLFAFWVYSVPAIAARDFGAAGSSYDGSADRAGLLFALFDATAMIAAFGLPVLVRGLGVAKAHMACLAFGAVGLFLFATSGSPWLSWSAAIGIGIAWASILSAPYAIVANAVPQDRLGTYMGIHNIFLVIPQLAAATSLGAILGVMPDGPLSMLWLAGTCLAAAAGCCVLLSSRQ